MIDASRVPAGPLVAVALVEYDSGDYLLRCLDSLFDFHPGLRLAVTVVDNGGADSRSGEAGRRWPEVEVIRNDANRGFAAAVNQALARVPQDAAYVLVLNPDVEFRADTLGPLLEFMEGRPDAGVVTPRLDDSDGGLQRTCRRREPTPAGILFHLAGLSRIFPSSGTFSSYTCGDIDPGETHPVDAVSGAFMLVRRQTIDQVGAFDERYFMYAEDLEFCRRVRSAGWKIFYHPRARAVHHGAVSSGRRPVLSIWHKHATAARYINTARRDDLAAPLRWLGGLALLVMFIPRALLSLFSGRRK